MQHRSRGFTLVEVMVAATIVVIIMIVLLGMTDQTQRLVKATSSKVEQFQEARVGFESMTRRLAQATLNSFWDYVYDSNGNPQGYERKAELRFHSGPMDTLTGNKTGLWPSHGMFFQAPLGMVASTGDVAKKNGTPDLGAMDHLMNTWGYFVEVGTDADKFPTFLKNTVNPRKRYRLMECMEPSEQLSVYKYQDLAKDSSNRLWFTSSILPTNPKRTVRVLAENVVALIVLPRLSLADEKRINAAKPPVLAPGYIYDSTTNGAYNADPKKAPDPINNNPLLNSKNQLPPVVQIIMVAIDEPSARRLEDLYGTSDPTYMGISTNPDPLSNQKLFTDPASLNDSINGTPGDLTRLQNLLSSTTKANNIRASYRIFSSSVSIKGAKWSLQ